MAFTNYKPNAFTELMEKFNLILYLCGLQDFLIEPAQLSEKFMKIFNVFSFFLHMITVMFSVSLLSSFISQNNLSVKQRADQSICSFAVPFSNFYCFVFLYHKQRYREVMYTLIVLLKQDYNDQTLEKQVIKKLKAYVLAYYISGIFTLILYAFFGLVQVKSGYLFVTIITAWPDVRDESNMAEIVRIIFYIFWWIAFFRISGCYLLLLSLLISISHQYTNLQNYFYNLESIFKEDLSYVEKEAKYEKAFKRGVEIHSKTLWCINETQNICRVIFDIQMLLTIIAFVSLLPVLLVKDQNSNNSGTSVTYVPLMFLFLILAGFFMWNAGDISFEASKLADAMYHSGWQNCRGQSSVRIRKLVVIAMNQAQQPVTLIALGFIELSYDSYLAIIKTSYSVYSVFY